MKDRYPGGQEDVEKCPYINTILTPMQVLSFPFSPLFTTKKEDVRTWHITIQIHSKINQIRHAFVNSAQSYHLEVWLNIQ